MDLQHRLHPSQATLEPGVLALELLDPWILCLRLPASLSATSFPPWRSRHVGDANSIIATSTSPLDAEVRAATSPSTLPKASASRTIRSLYSKLKRRRFACSRTSGSLDPRRFAAGGISSRPTGSCGSRRGSLSQSKYSCVDHSSTLYTNFKGRSVSAMVGTEGFDGSATKVPLSLLTRAETGYIIKQTASTTGHKVSERRVGCSRSLERPEWSRTTRAVRWQ